MWGRNQKEKFNQRIAEDKAKSIIHSKTLLDFKRKRNYFRVWGSPLHWKTKKKKSQMDVESDLFYCFVSTSFGGWFLSIERVVALGNEKLSRR